MFIVGYFWFARVYSPKAEIITQRIQEREVMVTKLKSVEMKAKSLEELKSEYDDLLSKYHEIEALLPEVKQIPSFLVQLHTASSLTGCKITKLEPSDNPGETFYNIVKFNIELTGTYHDFGGFISYIANFPFITNVSDMRIKSLSVANTGANSHNNDKRARDLSKKETLVAKFTLSTYYVRPEGRLKELAFIGERAHE